MKTTDEETIYEQNGMVNEETVVDNENKNEETPQEFKTKQNRKWVDAGIGAGTGVAAGIIGTLFTSGTIQATSEDSENGGNEEGHEVVDDGLTTPVVTDGTLSIAHNVNDNMSFGEAFRVAHDEVGPGGVFEWHGQLYGTYTEAEWNSLSSEERMEYSSHLRVVGTPDYASNVSHHESPDEHAETHTEDVAVDVRETQEESQDLANNHNEVEVQEVEDGPVYLAGQSDDDEVEVLGVEYVQTENGQEVAIGGMSINGQEVFVLDADNDGLGDLAAMDANGNGHFEENEIVNLSEHPVDMSIFETTDPSICGGVTPAEPDYMPTENL